MSSTISTTLAGKSATYTSSKTDTQTGDAMTYFLADKETIPTGLTQAQLAQWLVDHVNAELVNYFKREARKNRLRQLQAASSVESQADSDTAI